MATLVLFLRYLNTPGYNCDILTEVNIERHLARPHTCTLTPSSEHYDHRVNNSMLRRTCHAACNGLLSLSWGHDP